MGELPTERALYNRAPFTAGGLDFAGSLPTTSQEKPLEVILFSCLTTRVVHLEVGEGKTASDVCRAWKGLLHKRGAKPEYVLSDGAKSFILAKSLITKKEKVKGSSQFRWEIAVPKAPHRCGSIEVMVKGVKRALKGLTERHKRERSFAEWSEIVSEVNFLLNKRPLLESEEEGTATQFTGNALMHPAVYKEREASPEEIL